MQTCLSMSLGSWWKEMNRVTYTSLGPKLLPWCVLFHLLAMTTAAVSSDASPADGCTGPALVHYWKQVQLASLDDPTGSPSCTHWDNSVDLCTEKTRFQHGVQILRTFIHLQHRRARSFSHSCTYRVQVSLAQKRCSTFCWTICNHWNGYRPSYPRGPES